MGSVSPSVLNFGAGLLAGTGINLLTSVVGGTPGPSVQLVIDSLLWIAAAACVTWTGHLVETAGRTADLYISAKLPTDAQDEVRRLELAKVARPLRLSGLLAGACCLAAVLLLPRLLPWRLIVDHLPIGGR